ncbi:MAG: tetratricopeptide repeat protein [Desulfuromonas sp.]|nr:tetratricopeptide repeat protein [Desulfuromonas sp.]
MIQPKSGGSLIGKISSYLQIVSKDPHSTAFVPLAEAYRQIGLLDDALEAARMCTSMLPNFSPGFATLGRILGQMGRVDEAMSAFARALSIDRQSQSALTGLARLHLVRGERDLARKILQQAAEFHPDDEMVENMLVALDLPRPWKEEPARSVVEELPTARAVVEEAVVESVGGEPIPTATLAEIYVKQGLIDQAVRVYEEILRLEPGNVMAARRLAELRGEPFAVPAPAAEPKPVEAVSLTPPRPQKPRQPLEVFEGWLQAIQIRRAHVQ